MIPKDEEESNIIRCFTLSLKGSMSGVEIESFIVKEFSKKYCLDFIELLQISKSMCSIFSENNK
jgi:hypothetical protein